jgi:hypothetical protein
MLVLLDGPERTAWALSRAAQPARTREQTPRERFRNFPGLPHMYPGAETHRAGRGRSSLRSMRTDNPFLLFLHPTKMTAMKKPRMVFTQLSENI